MNRPDFVVTLFDNGNGLTLNQIQTIENGLPDIIPDGMIEDIAKEFDDPNDRGIMESALEMCREHFINELRDCSDFLELRDYLAEHTNVGAVTDQQIYRLFYAVS